MISPVAAYDRHGKERNHAGRLLWRRKDRDPSAGRVKSMRRIHGQRRLAESMCGTGARQPESRKTAVVRALWQVVRGALAGSLGRFGGGAPMPDRRGMGEDRRGWMKERE